MMTRKRSEPAQGFYGMASVMWNRGKDVFDNVNVNEELRESDVVRIRG